ncbi:hypothetical protein NW762_011194 [Fusarium torreyae]|uniref:Uncharacterized protein n=1 Tax=Fusarium torreyae TaxID=1237075 RepID=A0A9W8V9Z4_9HYPO|nr:hypothetical protein NW762_011194 [Fusarium torreyae]
MSSTSASASESSEYSLDTVATVDQAIIVIEELSKDPVDSAAPNVRFGHLTVPIYHSSRYHMVQAFTNAIRKIDDSCPIIYVTSRVEQRLVSMTPVNSLGLLPKFAGQVLVHSWFLSTLEDNRAAFGDGPEAWKPSESTDLWHEQMILPNKAFVVFYLDPDLSADCSLALIGLVQWACDVSQRKGANIRVLVTSSGSESSLLSELVGIRSKEPVAHYELPIPTHFELIPEYRVDNAKENEILPHIRHRLETGAADERHAILYVPPYTGNEEFEAWDVFTKKDALCNKYVFNNGKDMIKALEYPWHPLGGNPKGVVINVDANHPIPAFLENYTHAHIVLGTHCLARIFDGESCQVVLASVALSKGQRDTLQWWCDQPNIDPENIWIYPGSHGFGPDEDTTVSRPAHIEGPHAGSFIAVVYAMSKWGVDAERVLRCFIKSPLVLQEMTNRLQHQGIIQEANSQLALTIGQERVFGAVLSTVGYDYHLAHFIALESPDVEVRRLKVQLAVFLLLKDDWNLQNHADWLDALVESWGWSKDIDSHGDLWRTFGLWKRISKDSQDFGDPDAVQFFDTSSTFSLSNETAFYFWAKTRDLEETLNEIAQDFDNVGLTPHNIRDETGVMSRGQLRQVMRHLLCAYLHQLVVTRLVEDNVEGGHRLDHTVYLTSTSVVLRA